mmetsp:Transcript_39844/g.129519  ORF Transcript_39844/g.129519 Transcript_39844/m.129519 type:complete len:220 (+) Transcript_39844:1-660(+)
MRPSPPPCPRRPTVLPQTSRGDGAARRGAGREARQTRGSRWPRSPSLSACGAPRNTACSCRVELCACSAAFSAEWSSTGCSARCCSSPSRPLARHSATRPPQPRARACSTSCSFRQRVTWPRARRQPPSPSRPSSRGGRAPRAPRSHLGLRAAAGLPVSFETARRATCAACSRRRGRGRAAAARAGRRTATAARVSVPRRWRGGWPRRLRPPAWTCRAY